MIFSLIFNIGARPSKNKVFHYEIIWGITTHTNIRGTTFVVYLRILVRRNETVWALLA